MGVLNSIVGWLVAFGAGFFGHVVAHDFCEVTPMISRKIIEAAASRLPASIRERYREEWRADLQAQSGALAKLAWSLGCLRSARRLRQEAAMDRIRRTQWVLTFATGETYTLNVATLAVYATSLVFAQYVSGWGRWLPKPVRMLALGITLAKPVYDWRKYGSPDYTRVKELLRLHAGGANLPTKVSRYVDGMEEETHTFDDGEQTKGTLTE
jgi:hypothetical protein